MSSSPRPITILLADDDPDDRAMIREAMEEARLIGDLRWVEDGEELMAYLLQRGPHGEPARSPRPDLILLDLNMPRKDGREALGEIKAHPALRTIPVIVLTTSTAEEDIARAYELGGDSFITKPVTFEALVEAMRTIHTYWLSVVTPPPRS